MLFMDRANARTALLIAVCLSAAAWLFSGASAAGRELLTEPHRASAVLRCFNGQNCLSSPTTWSAFLQHKPPCLQPFRIWWSQKPAPFPVTLVTQLSFERLQQVRAQCESWSGPLAAALYLPLQVENAGGTSMSRANQDALQRAVSKVQQLFDAAEHGHNVRLRCQLRLMLVYEFTADVETSDIYPVNSLRNYARLMADTELIANIDVDMLPSTSVSKTLSDPAQLRNYVDSARKNTVYVIPAFETVPRCGGPLFADRVAEMGKVELARQVEFDCVEQFRKRKALHCHSPTDFPRWFQSNQAYQVAYNISFEPWFISNRLNTKWFDARFRGYGKNKAMQVAHTNRSGAAFHVFPDGFLVHRAHNESAARKKFMLSKFSGMDMQNLKGTLYGHVETLWQRTTQELHQGIYEPFIEPQLRACLRSLKWWSGAVLPAATTPTTEGGHNGARQHTELRAKQ